MIKLVFYPALIISALLMMSNTISPTKNTLYISKSLPNTNTINTNVVNDENELTIDSYKAWNLDRAGLSEAAFKNAIKGFNYLNKAHLITKKNIVSIVDFSKPSTDKRLFIVDVSSGKVLYNTWVAHGKNSGSEYANQFSNLPESHQSSLGFFITMNTYIGGNGYSLKLNGCEKGINDKAYERAIVIHGADYASNQFINSRGLLGRSYGCPAIPTQLSRQIIDVIKNGSCLYLYHPTKNYYTHSKILNSHS